MIRVLHWINLTRLYRCHLTFENTSEITHYYITDKARNVLKHKPNVYAGTPRSIAFLKKMLLQIKPHVIVCSNLIQPRYMMMMKKHCQHFVYICHTIWTDDTIRMKIANHVREKSLTSYGVFDRLFFRPKEIEMWRTIGMPENKLIPVHGLTYMDVALTANTLENKVRVLTPFFKNKTKEEIENLKLILLIHNNTMTGCIHPNGSPKSAVQNSKEYGIILNQMNQYAEEHDCYVITKIGRKSSTLIENEFIKSIHKSPRVIVIRPEQDYLLSDFLFCDAIINQSYSAAYQESLLANHCVACCYLEGKEMINFYNLPVIRSQEEIKPMIDQFINQRSNFYQEEINQQIDQLIKETFGDKLENVTERVIQDILDRFKDEDLSKTAIDEEDITKAIDHEYKQENTRREKIRAIQKRRNQHRKNK